MFKSLRNRELFERVYTELETWAGAPPALRQEFVNWAVKKNEEDPYATGEFRFSGKLGAGGKVFITPESFHVNTYAEDLDARPARQSLINFTNSKLREVFRPPEDDLEDDTPVQPFIREVK